MLLNWVVGGRASLAVAVREEFLIYRAAADYATTNHRYARLARPSVFRAGVLNKMLLTKSISTGSKHFGYTVAATIFELGPRAGCHCEKGQNKKGERPQREAHKGPPKQHAGVVNVPPLAFTVKLNL